MKGFGIYVKNNLLEAKHIEAMGESVWLYMWFLDKMTSVNENGLGKVLGGKPITHAMVAIDLGIDERRYQRWIKRLRESSYIKTLRTPYGLSITVLKAEKIFKKRSDKNVISKKLKKSDTTKVSEQIRQKRRTDTTKVSHLSDKNVGSNIKDNTVDNTVDNNTNVLDPSGLGPRPSYGKPEINELFTFWSGEVGYDIESKVAANRRAASNLLKKFGPDKLQSLIRGVALAHGDQYAPGIADFCDLQSKTNQLIVWGKKKHIVSGIEEIS